MTYCGSMIFKTCLQISPSCKGWLAFQKFIYNYALFLLLFLHDVMRPTWKRHSLMPKTSAARRHPGANQNTTRRPEWFHIMFELSPQQSVKRCDSKGNRLTYGGLMAMRAHHVDAKSNACLFQLTEPCNQYDTAMKNT